MVMTHEEMDVSQVNISSVIQEFLSRGSLEVATYLEDSTLNAFLRLTKDKFVEEFTKKFSDQSKTLIDFRNKLSETLSIYLFGHSFKPKQKRNAVHLACEDVYHLTHSYKNGRLSDEAKIIFDFEVKANSGDGESSLKIILSNLASLTSRVNELTESNYALRNELAELRHSTQIEKFKTNTSSSVGKIGDNYEISKTLK